MKIPFKALLIFLFFLSAISVCAQEEVDYRKDRFSASLGGFYTGLNSSVIVGIDQLGLGIGLQLEDALGLDPSVLVIRGEGQYSFGKNRNKRLTLSYLALLRKADRTLGREIQIGEVTLPLESRIRTKFNLEIYELSYNWGFFQDERMRLGVGGGLFVMPLGFSIAVNDNESSFIDFVAPLPSLEVSTEFYLGPRWTYSQTLNIFYVNIGNFEGSLNDFSLNIEYRPFDHFAFGTGLNSFRLNVEATDDLFLNLDFKGDVQVSYFGALFFARYLIKYKD